MPRLRMENKMKKSIYLLDYESKDGKYYLMSTYSGNIISIDSAKKKKLQNILDISNTDMDRNSPVVVKLVSLGFIIDENVNEFQRVTGERILRSFTENNYLELSIMPTEKCNFRCVYCYENFEKPKMSNTTCDAIIKYVKKHIANHQGLVVSWFGGEPLLAVDVIEKLSEAFIQICKDNHKVYHSSITTNAYLLDLETFEKLRKFHINHFQITVDGDRETHHSQRVLADGRGSFDEIMSNLKTICEHGKGNLWTISLRTNVTNQIIKNIEQFKNDVLRPFREDHRVYIMLRKMWTNNTKEADSLICDDHEFEQFINECQISAHSLYLEYVFSHNMNFMCYAANPNAFVIGSDGMVYKCTCGFYDEINQVGRLRPDGYMALDTAKMSYWVAPRAGNQEKCITCVNYATCVSNGCPYHQDQPCDGKTLDILRYYIPQFFKLAQKSEDLSDLI